jgi:glutamine synthetase
MESMQKVALRHDLVCLLHEKPFAGVNGSGKHNNWSLSTDDGQNLLEPGKTPSENEQFLIFVSALLMAVDRHADKLRASCGNPGNDLRLGANEAPPAIISVFMGEEFTEILEGIAKAKVESVGRVSPDRGRSLPPLPKDNTDRNRTAFAFTGNKFEFAWSALRPRSRPEHRDQHHRRGSAMRSRRVLRPARWAEQGSDRDVRDSVKTRPYHFNGNNHSTNGLRKPRNAVCSTSRPDRRLRYGNSQAQKLFDKYQVLSQELHSREIYSKGM